MKKLVLVVAMFMFVCDGFNLDLNMKLKTDNQNFNKKIIMKKLTYIVTIFLYIIMDIYIIQEK